MINICFLVCILVFGPYVYIDFQRKILCEAKFENKASITFSIINKYGFQIVFQTKETLDEDRTVKKV